MEAEYENFDLLSEEIFKKVYTEAMVETLGLIDDLVDTELKNVK